MRPHSSVTTAPSPAGRIAAKEPIPSCSHEVKSLVLLAASGEEAAFEELVRRFQNLAVGYSYSIVRDFHTAQDITQEALVDTYRLLPKLRRPEAFSGWLRTIVFKHCDRHLRRKQATVVAGKALGNVATGDPSPPQELERKDRMKLVQEAMGGLSQQERTAIVLYYFNDYSYREIAEFLEVAESTVNNRMHTGRKRLKEEILRMVEENLESHRPSNNSSFVEGVIRIIQPEGLRSDEPQGAWSCRGTETWAMICACLTGDVGKIETLLRSDPNLVRAEYWYTQPLHFAVREGHLEAVRVLLRAGADPGFIRYSGEDLVTVARDRRHEAVAIEIQQALNERAGAKTEDHGIHTAVKEGDFDTVSRNLKEEPSLIHRIDSLGCTPLHLAARADRSDLAELLLDSGADPNALILGDDTYSASLFRPLDLAFWKSLFWQSRPNEEMAALLLERGAEYPITIAAARGDIERVKALLREDPALANDPLPCRKRPLSAALERGHRKIAHILLDHGADPSLPEGRYAPQGAALHAAARRNDFETAALLLKRGADPNSYINSGGSAVFAAKDHALRNLLLSHGGTLDAFDLVWEGDFDGLMEIAKRDPLAVARSGCGGCFAAVVKTENWEMLRALLKLGVRVPDLVTGCRTYLWHVPDMARLLLEHGMDPNLPNWQRVTPLHDICNRDGRNRPDPNRLQLADLFLEFGADINAIDEEYRSTPLGWAARNGLPDMVSLLLGRGADRDVAGAPWATPLAWAAKRGYREIVDILEHRS